MAVVNPLLNLCLVVKHLYMLVGVEAEVSMVMVVAVAVKADMVPVRSAGSKGFGNRHTSPFWFNQSILTG